MLFRKLFSFTVFLNISTFLTIPICLCASDGNAIEISPVPAPQGFLKIPAQSHTSSLTTSGKSVHGITLNAKTSFNPLRKMAEDVKRLIEEYTKRRNLARKRGVENRYDELLKDANDLAKEIEAASNEHDIRMEQYQKGDVKSGEQAIRLTELIQSRTEPFNSLISQMDLVIAEIKNDASIMPAHALYDEISPTSKLVPASPRRGQEKMILPEKSNLREDDEDMPEIAKRSGRLGQPLKSEDSELEKFGG